MVLFVVVGGKHVSLNEVLLVTTSTSKRGFAQVVLDAGVLEGINKATPSAKTVQNINIPSSQTSSDDGTKQENLSHFHVRAALFARVIHAMQGRSGLQVSVIQFLVDLLNANIQNLECPAHDLKFGESLIGLITGSNISLSLAKEFADKGIEKPKFDLSKDELNSLLLNSSTLALVGAGASFLASCSVAIGCVDTVAALTCAAIGVPNELKDDSGYEFRPHRAITTSAANLKALLRESVECSLVKPELVRIPEEHGPSIECISSCAKTMVIELNSFEKEIVTCSSGDSSSPSAYSSLGPAPTLSLLRNVVMAIVSLEQTSRNRLSLTRKGIRPWNPPSLSLFTMSSWELMKVCSDQIESLQNALVAETDSAVAMIKSTINTLKQQANDSKNNEVSNEMSAEVKARIEAVAQAENQKRAKMSPEELAKYEKKKAEKEAKAAAKAASKKNKDSGGGAGGGGSKGGKSFKLSPGIEAVYHLFQDSASIEEKISFAGGLFADEVASLMEALTSGGKNRTPKIARGTRDFGPQQMKVRSGAFAKIREVFDKHGAVEIDTPVFELKETLTGKYGEDSKLIYDLADQGGELLALRYDLTVPFARFLAMHSVGNIKRFHIAKVYRRDNPQLAKGRYREFYQCDFDIAGTYLPMVADAEVVTLATEILASLEIGSFVVKLNHRVILDAVFELCGVPADKFRAICSAVDKLDKSPWSEVRREMTEDKGLSDEVADKIGTLVQRRGSPREMQAELLRDKCFGSHVAANKALDDLSKLWDYLEAMGSLKFVSFDLSLARGLDYYTGLIYECVHTEEGGPGVGSIAAGGRYDNLVNMFSDNNAQVPCVGVSIGVERIFAILEAKHASMRASSVTCFVASVGKGMLVERMKAAQKLWAENISAEFWQNKENPRFAGPGSQLDFVLKSEIPIMVIVGEEETKQGLVKVKQLSYDGGGNEDGGVPVPISELASYVKALLGEKSSSSSSCSSSSCSSSSSLSSNIITPIAEKQVCCVPAVKLNSTAKFAVLNLTQGSSQKEVEVVITEKNQDQRKKKASTVSELKTKKKAKEEDDDIDLGFDDEDEEEEDTSANKPKSRAEQAAELKKKRDAELEEKKAAAMARLAKKEANQRSLCNLEIKPWESEQDLLELFAKIKKTVVKDGLKWSENCALVDVAFGIKKLVLTAVISLNLSMDAIIEEMTEETFVDEIQSMQMTSMSLL